jgi:hypothetical protein
MGDPPGEAESPSTTSAAQQTNGSLEGKGKVTSRDRYVTFQMAKIAVPRQMFVDILSLIARLRAPPAPA